MAKKILLVLVALIVVLAIVIATRPSSYHVERSMEMNAPADIPYSLVADFHNWEKWSPWEKLDPQMKRTFDGPTSGAGAKYGWTGNDKVGEGKMEITEATPNEKIAMRLDFIKPWQSLNSNLWTFAATGDKTKVTWVMDGSLDFMGKAFSLFMNMDTAIGQDFDKGLTTMKGLAEAEAQKRKEEAEKAAAAAVPAEAAPAEGEMKKE